MSRSLSSVCSAICSAMVLACAAGCAHQTVIHTVPSEAMVTVDDVEVGKSPVVLKRPIGTFGNMHVVAKSESFMQAEQTVKRSEWFLWPGALALTPAMGLLAAPLLPAGPFVCAGWMAATSPALASLFYLRAFPSEITLTLQPRISMVDGAILSTDRWTQPDDYAANPLPSGVKPPPPPPRETPVPKPVVLPQQQQDWDTDDGHNPLPFSLQSPDQSPDSETTPPSGSNSNPPSKSKRKGNSSKDSDSKDSDQKTATQPSSASPLLRY